MVLLSLATLLFSASVLGPLQGADKPVVNGQDELVKRVLVPGQPFRVPSRSVRVQVVDRGTGLPVAGAQVVVSHPGRVTEPSLLASTRLAGHSALWSEIRRF
jgi:hypothetical protein